MLCVYSIAVSHQRLRHMHVHLVAVEIRIVRRAHTRIEPEGAPRADADAVAPARENERE